MRLSSKGIELTREGIRAATRGDSKEIIARIEEKIIRNLHVIKGFEEYHSNKNGEEPRVLEIPEMFKNMLLAIYGKEWVEFKLYSIFWPLIEGRTKEKDLEIPTHRELSVPIQVYLEGMRETATELIRGLNDYRMLEWRNLTFDKMIELLERFLAINGIIYRFLDQFSSLHNHVLSIVPKAEPVLKMASKRPRDDGSFKMSLGSVRDSADKARTEFLNMTSIAASKRDRNADEQKPEPRTAEQQAETAIHSDEAAVVSPQAS